MTEANPKTDYEFLIPGEPNYLGAIRWIITRLAVDLGINEEAISKIEVAVDEACSNVMEHAYGDLPDKPPIHITINSSEGRFTVDIMDQGPPFDYEHRPQNKFPEHYLEGHTRGAGLYIINECMDEVSHERLSNEWNRMRLVKLVASPAPTPTPAPEPEPADAEAEAEEP